jgi:hypothetical protein
MIPYRCFDIVVRNKVGQYFNTVMFFSHKGLALGAICKFLSCACKLPSASCSNSGYFLELVHFIKIT